MQIDRATFLRPTIRVEPVDCPEFGGIAYVKTMTGAERLEFFTNAKASDAGRSAALLICLTLCDADGNRLLTLEDVATVEAHDGGLVNRLCNVVNRLNGFNEEAEAEAKKN